MVASDCIDDGNFIGWSNECDADLEVYESDDVADLALSNVGEIGKELAGNMGLIVILLIVSFIIGWAIKTKLSGTKLAK